MDIKLTSADGLFSIDNEAQAELVKGNPFGFHSIFHEVCQKLYREVSTKRSGVSPWSNLGYGVIKQLVAESDALDLSREFARHIKKQENGANLILEFPPEVQRHILKLVSDVFNSGLAGVIEDHLGCYFRVSNIECMRTQYSKSQEVSFRWHRDIAPVAQIHAIIHLTRGLPNSPATLFCNLKDTRRIAKLGYAFPRFADRVPNINAWLPDNEPPMEIFRPELCAGDATIFDAPRILHKGDLHEGGPHRDVILIPILPSLNPWDLELELLQLEELFCSGKSTLWTNPFELKAPPVYRESINEELIPEWVKQSQYFRN